MDDKKFQIIYSLRIMRNLVEQGIFPIRTMPNPVNIKYNCWVFEDTEEFRNKFSVFQKKAVDKVGQKS